VLSSADLRGERARYCECPTTQHTNSGGQRRERCSVVLDRRMRWHDGTRVATTRWRGGWRQVPRLVVARTCSVRTVLLSGRPFRLSSLDLRGEHGRYRKCPTARQPNVAGGSRAGQRRAAVVGRGGRVEGGRSRCATGRWVNEGPWTPGQGQKHPTVIVWGVVERHHALNPALKAKHTHARALWRGGGYLSPW
jgi:hypothetical protein